MAISVSKAVWKCSGAKGNSLLVLLALADFVFEETLDEVGEALAWPSQSTLADRCNCSRSTVELALRALAEEGEIEDTGDRRGGRYRGTTVWSILPGVVFDDGLADDEEPDR